MRIIKNILRKNFQFKVTTHCFYPSIICLLFLPGINRLLSANIFQKINLTDFYSSLESQDTAKLNSFLLVLENDSGLISQAYTGALLMKKSGMQKTAKEKLSMFKKGKALLEDAIKKENKNGEFYFLRLIIQENCPDFLKYKDNIKEDVDAVKQMYKKFSPALKQVVIDYSKKSKALKADEFPTEG